MAATEVIQFSFRVQLRFRPKPLAQLSTNTAASQSTGQSSLIGLIDGAGSARASLAAGGRGL